MYHLTFRHARTSISSGRGGFSIQPFSRRGGGKSQGCSVFGESIGYADGHDLKTLLTWVRNLWHTIFCKIIYPALFTFFRILIWTSFYMFVQTCLTSLTCVVKWQSSASLRPCTDLERTSLARSTSQRATFLACRCFFFFSYWSVFYFLKIRTWLSCCSV